MCSSRIASSLIERDPPAQVEPDHALADAVQHRVAVLHEAGDLGRLHAEGLPLHPAGDQQRAADADRAGQPEVGQQVRGGRRQPVQDRRVEPR